MTVHASTKQEDGFTLMNASELARQHILASSVLVLFGREEGVDLVYPNQAMTDGLFIF
jgi:hypothetical protein